MIPTVAAVDGLALGGGCEFMMHCDRAVATMESYIGLVEAGVGLLPAGGGCKELALRASQDAKGGDPFPFAEKLFSERRDGAGGQKCRACARTRLSARGRPDRDEPVRTAVRRQGAGDAQWLKPAIARR